MGSEGLPRGLPQSVLPGATWHCQAEGPMALATTPRPSTWSSGFSPLRAAAGSPYAENGGGGACEGGVETGDGVMAATLTGAGRSLHACFVF